METQYKPNYAVHPGRILAEDMEELGITPAGLATRIGVSEAEITEIIEEKKGVSNDLAARLQPIFGYLSDFWLKVQENYDKFFEERRKRKGSQ